MCLKDQPHSSWAEVYDLAYEHSFGEFYHRLTDVTMLVIAEKIDPPARIVDFGAGTGRLSIPLAERGYQVTAVEPCAEMRHKMERKRCIGTVHTVDAKMEHFVSEKIYDMALCVFTVVIYLLDEDALKQALTAVFSVLKAGGILLVDVPTRAVFASYSRKDPLMDRIVTMRVKAGDIYRYQESIEVHLPDGTTSKYQDDFQVRYWSPEVIIQTAQEIGFFMEEDLSSRFSFSGSQYFALKKST